MAPKPRRTSSKHLKAVNPAADASDTDEWCLDLVLELTCERLSASKISVSFAVVNFRTEVLSSTIELFDSECERDSYRVMSECVSGLMFESVVEAVEFGAAIGLPRKPNSLLSRLSDRLDYTDCWCDLDFVGGYMLLRASRSRIMKVMS